MNCTSIKNFSKLFLFLAIALSCGTALALPGRIEDGGNGGGGGGGGVDPTPTVAPPTATPTITPTPTFTATPTIVPTVAATPTIAPTPNSVADNCPEDPDKTEAGLCGCGVPDLDQNTNGIADCNITAEFLALVVDSYGKVLRLENVKKRAVMPEQKQLRKELLSDSRGVLRFAKGFKLGIRTVSAGFDVSKKSKEAMKRVRRTARAKDSSFTNLRRLALRHLVRLAKGVENGARLLVP